jgi:hypothetical protein
VLVFRIPKAKDNFIEAILNCGNLRLEELLKVVENL